MLALGAAVGVSPAAATLPSPYLISVFAGTGTGGAPTLGPAASSNLNVPFGDTVDAHGNAYIADLGNSAIEEVAPAGTLSVIAGNGTSSPATPGPATGTGLGPVTGVAIAGDGTVYVSDYGYSEIYKITPAGTLSIFAGTGSEGPPTPGPATDSQLDQPYAVAVDASGDLYIADSNNNLIEEVTPAGILSVVAGNGASGPPSPGPATSSDLAFPEGVAVDSAGDVYISDESNNVIEEVTPSGSLSVIAGTGTVGPPTPGPATSSDLDNPAGISLDAAGNLYVADHGNGDIEEITPSGTLSVIAGDDSNGAPTYGGSATASSLDGPQAVASTPAGRLYVADPGNNTIDLLVPPPPVNTAPPSTSGMAQVGQTLTATEGSWTLDPIIYDYQWQDCDAAGTNCVDIPAATGSTYTLASADAGHTVRVVVTAENGGGATIADSPASGVIPSSTTTPATVSPATPTTATTRVVGVDETTASPKVRGQWAILGGLVAANARPVSYAFQYGSTRRHTAVSTAKTLTASTTEQAVTTTVRRLLPGTVYRYRLVVTTANGTTSHGADKTLTTPRVMPRRVRDHIYFYSDRHAPYDYRVHGRMILPKGLSHTAACRTGGIVTITATTADEVVARHRVTVSAACTYTSSFRLTTTQLPGAGHASFSMSYAGNRQLRARQARTLNVLYGPDAKHRG